MQNYRKQIKETITNYIKTSALKIGVPVDLIFSHKKAALDFESEMKSGLIIVDADSESSSVFTQSPKQTKRTLKLSISILKAKTPEENTELEDQLNDFTHSIEELMIRWELIPSLREIVNNLDFDGAEFDYNADSEFRQGMARVNYSIIYFQDESIPESELDDFLSANTVIEHQKNKEFESSVTIPQQ